MGANVLPVKVNNFLARPPPLSGFFSIGAPPFWGLMESITSAGQITDTAVR